MTLLHLPIVMIPANAQCKHLLLSNIFKQKVKTERFRFITPSKRHFPAMADHGDNLLWGLYNCSIGRQKPTWSGLTVMSPASFFDTLQ